LNKVASRAAGKAGPVNQRLADIKGMNSKDYILHIADLPSTILKVDVRLMREEIGRLGHGRERESLENKLTIASELAGKKEAHEASLAASPLTEERMGDTILSRSS